MQLGYGNRLRARLVAVQVLFQDDLNREVNPAHADDFVRRRLRDPQLVEFARSLVAGVRRNRPELDELLTAVAENWSLDRMATTDRNVLRLGAYEIFHTETPRAVCINEAVELAKRLGGLQSGPFVNGILDRLLAAPPAKRAEAIESPLLPRSEAVDAAPAGLDIHLGAREGSVAPPPLLSNALRSVRLATERRTPSPEIHFPPENLALCRQRLVAYAEEHRTKQSGGRGAWKWEEALEGESGLLHALGVEPLFKDVVQRRAVALNLREQAPAAGAGQEAVRDFWESDEGWRAFLEVVRFAVEDRRADRSVRRIRTPATKPVVANTQSEIR